jgi:hypothetical protein
MKRIVCFGFLMLSVYTITAQDEGVITKRERLDRSKSIFLGAGASVPFGKNIGDYSGGFSIEAGFVKRLNRVFSIGPSISYQSFKYDPEVTSAAGGGAFYGHDDIDIKYSSQYDTWTDKYTVPANSAWDYAYVLTLEGGDLSLISLGVNLKFNFIPIRDNTKFSVYGFAKPFIAFSKRGEVTGSGQRWVWEAYEDTKNTTTENDDVVYPDQNDNKWYKDSFVDAWTAKDGYPVLEEESSVTGGIFLGPGVEFMPTNSVSIFAQAAFGYTFPVSYVSTKSYDDSIESYLDDEFPMVKKGFPSFGLQIGVSYNF